MSDTEILDKGETLVALLPWSTENRHTGFSFETITYISEVKCARCGYSFPISVSDSMSSEEVYDKTAGWPIAQLLEFSPYSCPHCGSRITGIYSYINKQSED